MSDIIIKISNATVRFNQASERYDGLKEYVIKMIKGELMFQEFLALKDINVEIKRGEAWGLVGANGSGKSTLLKLICRILKPYKGSINVYGSVAPLIELGAGFDPQLTARENVFLNGALLGYKKSFMQEHFDEIIQFAELENFVDTPLKNFSSGMSARLGFAVATISKPDILVIDEVLAVGDAAFQEKCRIRMQNLLSGGTTLLFVSHNAEQIRKLCNKALYLKQGEIQALGKVDEVLDLYNKQFS